MNSLSNRDATIRKLKLKRREIERNMETKYKQLNQKTGDEAGAEMTSVLNLYQDYYDDKRSQKTATVDALNNIKSHLKDCGKSDAVSSHESDIEQILQNLLL